MHIACREKDGHISGKFEAPEGWVSMPIRKIRPFRHSITGSNVIVADPYTREVMSGIR